VPARARCRLERDASAGTERRPAAARGREAGVGRVRTGPSTSVRPFTRAALAARPVIFGGFDPRTLIRRRAERRPRDHPHRLGCRRLRLSPPPPPRLRKRHSRHDLVALHQHQRQDHDRTPPDHLPPEEPHLQSRHAQRRPPAARDPMVKRTPPTLRIRLAHPPSPRPDQVPIRCLGIRVSAHPPQNRSRMTGNQATGPDDDADSPTVAELVLTLRAASRALQTLHHSPSAPAASDYSSSRSSTRAAEGDGVTPLDVGRRSVLSRAP